MISPRSVGLLVIAVLAHVAVAAHASSQEPSSSPPARALGVVLASSLNVRAAPGLNADVRTTAARGDTLCIVSVDGDWARVRLPRDSGSPEVMEGFASRGFLSEVRVVADDLETAGCGRQGR